MLAASCALGVCGLVLVVTSWLRRDKQMNDWAMAIGSTLALIGALGLMAALLRVRMFQSDQAGLFIIGVGTMGVIVFTMGFAANRVSDYRKKQYQEFIAMMESDD